MAIALAAIGAPRSLPRPQYPGCNVLMLDISGISLSGPDPHPTKRFMFNAFRAILWAQSGEIKPSSERSAKRFGASFHNPETLDGAGLAGNPNG